MTVLSCGIPRPFGVLFVCNDNSRTSLIAEALFRSYGIQGARCFSAGLAPTDSVDPFTLSMLTLAGFECDGLWPKHWNGFADKEHVFPIIDFLVVLGDETPQELKDAFPGAEYIYNWPIDDEGLTRHAGAWNDIRLLRPHVRTLFEDIVSMRDASHASHLAAQ